RLALGLADVDGDDATARGVEVRDEVEERALIVDEVKFCLELVDQLDGQAIGLVEILVGDAALPTGGAVANVDDEIMAILGGAGGEGPHRVLGPVVDEDIVGLWGAKAVIVDFLVEVEALECLAGLWLGESAVEKAAGVDRPRGLAELAPLDLVVERLAGLQVEPLPGNPVGAGLGDGVGEVLAVLAERWHPRQGDGAVFRPLVRIENDLRLAIELIDDIKDRLILQSVVFQVVIAAGDLEGGGVASIVPQLGESLADM